MASELKELGRRVRKIRKERGWSQEALAAEAKLDRSYMGGVERGERNITFTKLCQIAEALECDVGALAYDLPKRVKKVDSPPAKFKGP